MIIKNSVYGNKWGYLDPEVLSRTKKKKLLTDEDVNKKIDITKIDFLQIRSSMGSPNKDLTTTKIIVKNILIKCHSRYIPAIICHPQKIRITDNACLYLHGGGFIGGNSSTILNQCKLIAEKANCTVIALDYRLAPETPFPGALQDCLEAIEWIINNKNKLGFINSQIFIAGDSAGGNLAIVCGLSDKNHFLKQVISIYGALDLQKTSKTIYHWSYSDYKMINEQTNFIHTRLNKIILINNIMRPLYINNQNVTNYLISPIYAKNFKNMPPVTLIEAEFDYFLPSNRYFANLLRKNGIAVKEILYKGLDHGFFDRLGFLKQTKDACIEIANIIANKS